MKKLLISVALIALAGSASAQDVAKRVKAEDVAWTAHPFFKGVQTTVLIGDPTKAEVVVQRLKFPPNFQIAPHTHPYSEVVTVMSGSIGAGTGEKFDPAKGEMLKAGSLNAIPAKQSHFVWTGNEEAIVQVQFIGPAGINFINLADDPRKK